MALYNCSLGLISLENHSYYRAESFALNKDTLSKTS